MRDNGDAPAGVLISESTNEGKSWSVAAKTTIPDMDSVELLVFQDGKWAFIGILKMDGTGWAFIFLTTKATPGNGNITSKTNNPVKPAFLIRL